jgi:hypothetical protein
MLPNFSDGVCSSDDSMSARLALYPFLEYAAQYWGVEGKEMGDSMWQYLQRFARNSSAVGVASQASTVRDSRFFNWSQEYVREVPALALASCFDIPAMLRRLVADGHAVEGHGSDGATPLIRAATGGLTQNVRVLLELGACVDARDHMDDTSLLRAAKNGDEDTVSALLEGSANVNIKGACHWTPLMSAVSTGSMNVVQKLVQAGADLAAESTWGDSALSLATRHGQVSIATFLADNGAILPKGPAGRRASIVASRSGHHQLVRRLTADYEAIAGKTLDRQSSVLMRDLPALLEEDGPMLVPIRERAERTGQSSAPSIEDTSDLMEALDYTVGFSRRYTLYERLGKGHFSGVFRCCDKVTGLPYAAKVFTLQERNAGGSVVAEFCALRDIMKYSHPNILRMVDLLFEPNPNKLYLVLELASGGELFSYIVMQQKLTEAESRGIFLQLFSALKFLVRNRSLNSERRS